MAIRRYEAVPTNEDTFSDNTLRAKFPNMTLDEARQTQHNIIDQENASRFKEAVESVSFAALSDMQSALARRQNRDSDAFNIYDNDNRLADMPATDAISELEGMHSTDMLTNLFSGIDNVYGIDPNTGDIVAGRGGKANDGKFLKTVSKPFETWLGDNSLGNPIESHDTNVVPLSYIRSAAKDGMTLEDVINASPSRQMQDFPRELYEDSKNLNLADGGQNPVTWDMYRAIMGKKAFNDTRPDSFAGIRLPFFNDGARPKK